MKYGVFICRAQPLNLNHETIIREASTKYDKLLILIGSSEATPSLRNPFSFMDRMTMVFAAFPMKVKEKLSVTALPDSNYDFNEWIRKVQSIVFNATADDPKPEISLIGHYKDSGSYWLDHFPQWNLDNVSNMTHNNSTSVRIGFFNGDEDLNQISIPVKDIMLEWKRDHTKLFSDLAGEQKFIIEYRAKWANAPFPPTFVTVDSLVICKGNVLVIKRGRHPGKGLYALPGGFVDQTETLKDAAIRELKEETGIGIHKPILEHCLKQVKTIDNPYRDPRGRTITFCHLFEVDNGKFLPSIKSGDDASDVFWMPFGEVDLHQQEFFSDHYQIIQSMW